MIKYAITGNIASGKSEVEKILIAKGYKVFDTDIIAHEILNSSKEIIVKFKNYDVFENGIISRKKMGYLVFSNNILKKELENIIHPQIKIRIQNIFNENNNENHLFISVPLLFEANMQDLFDKIILIKCNEQIRLNRLIKRNNLTKQQAILRISSQINEQEKEKLSDYVIINNSTIYNLKEQIDKFF